MGAQGRTAPLQPCAACGLTWLPRMHVVRMHQPWPACGLQVMAAVMGAEAALVRVQFMSGTHAIAAALYAVLRPGDEMLAVAGQ